MAATKYVPQLLCGLLVADAPAVVFTPGEGTPVPEAEILTGVLLVNSAGANRTVSVYYTNDATSIYLFHQLLLPAHSTSNLDLYLPLVAGQNVSAVASVADEVSLTLYGLRMETV